MRQRQESFSRPFKIFPLALVLPSKHAMGEFQQLDKELNRIGFSLASRVGLQGGRGDHFYSASRKHLAPSFPLPVIVRLFRLHSVAVACTFKTPVVETFGLSVSYHRAEEVSQFCHIRSSCSKLVSELLAIDISLAMSC